MILEGSMWYSQFQVWLEQEELCSETTSWALSTRSAHFSSRDQRSGVGVGLLTCFYLFFCVPESPHFLSCQNGDSIQNVYSIVGLVLEPTYSGNIEFC